MAKTKRLKFTVNTHYEGKLVGPDGENDPVEVDEFWAKHFIANNAAVEVTEDGTTGADKKKKQS